MWSRVNRLRHFHTGVLHHTEWTRHLGSPGIAAFIGSVGFPLGIFLLIPYCAREISGPSTSLSVLIVFITTILTGLHLVEMCGRIPKSGCTYAFAYATFGELWAFLCAWMTIMDYCAMAAVLAKGWSSHFDFMFHENVRKHMNPSLFDTTMVSTVNQTDGYGNEISVRSGSIFDQKLDVLAAVGLAVATLVTLFGVSVVSTTCMALLIVGVLIVSSSILVGFFYADLSIWTQSGFFIGGFEGVCTSASYLLRPMIGLEMVGSLVEETTNPQNRFAVLLPLMNTLLFIYQFLISIVITLVIPYYQIPINAALPSIYGLISVPASRYVLSVASICTLSGAVIASLLPPVRYLHAMSSDGLLCGTCSRFSTMIANVPIVSVLVTILITGFFLLIDSSVLLSVLRILLPARYMVLTAAAVLQRYRETATGLLSEVANYKAMQVKSRSLSSFCTGGEGSYCSSGLRNGSMDWIVGSSIGSRKASDRYSVSSSFIMRNIAAAQYEMSREEEEDDDQCDAIFEHKERSKKRRRRQRKTLTDGDETERLDTGPTSTLDEDEVTIFSRSVQPTSIPRSATGELPSYRQYGPSKARRGIPETSSCGNIKSSGIELSLQSVTDHTNHQNGIRTRAAPPSGSHNCIRSPCTPVTSSDPFYHLYQRDPPETVPYCETFSMYAPSSTAVNQCIVYRKAKLWLGFVLCGHLAFAICLVRGWNELEKGVWWIYLMTLISFTATLIGSAALGWLPQNVDNRIRHQAPAAPYLALSNIFLLTLMLASADFGGVWKTALVLAIGFLVYFLYGYRHSNEYRNSLHVAPQRLPSDIDENTGLVAPLSTYQASETGSKRSFIPPGAVTST